MSEKNENPGDETPSDDNPYTSPADAKAVQPVTVTRDSQIRRRVWYAVGGVFLCGLVALAGVVSEFWYAGSYYGIGPGVLANFIRWTMVTIHICFNVLGTMLIVLVMVRGNWLQRTLILIPGVYVLMVMWMDVRWMLRHLLEGV